VKGVSVFIRRLRGPALVAAGLVLVAALGFGAYGCGSGGDTTTAAEPTSAASERSDRPSAVAEPAQRPSGAGAKDVKGSEDAVKGPDEDVKRISGQPGGQAQPQGPAKARSGSGDDPRVAGLSPSELRTAVRKARASCPAGVSAAQCKATVEKYVGTPAGPSHPVVESEDCLDFMGRAECEAMLTAQQAASGVGVSVNVEECLRNPTPECEAVLKPILEAQQAGK
jgi:hypothetical protein